MNQTSAETFASEDVAHRRRFRPQSSAMAKWVDKHKGALVFGGLCLGGVLLHFLPFLFSPWPQISQYVPHWLDEMRVFSAHALVVSGLLGATVDRLLKLALVKDVGSIFIGWALPQEVRDHIRHVSETAIVRRNCTIEYVLKEEGSDVVVDVCHESDVFNFGSARKEYRASLAVDKCERPDEDSVSLEITTAGATTRWDAAALNLRTLREEDAQLFRWQAPIELKLPPQNAESAD